MKLTRKLNWKLLKFFFFLSPVLLIVGLIAGIVSGSWSGIPSALIVSAFVILALWLLFEGYMQPDFWRRRSTQVGTNALISTLAVLVILGLVNFLAVRMNARADLTENQIFTLAPQSQELVRQLPQPVKVVLFTPQPNPIDQQLLDNYRRLNPQFSYEYIDPQKQPGIAREFKVQAIGDVFIESGTNRKSIQTVTAEQRLSERRLTNGIAQVTNGQTKKVYLLQGHGERKLEAGQGGFSQATGRLGDEGYKTEPLNLAENPKVPEDASVLVLASPQRALLESEVNALKEYLKRKSGLMVLVDPQTDPKLEGLLRDWGIQFSDRLVIDPAGQASGLGPGVTIISQYGDHPITRGFGNGISFYPLARPVQQTAISGTEATALLITSDRTQAQLIAPSGELKSDPADPKGPFSIGYALSRTVETTPTPSPSPSPSPKSQSETEPKAQARLIAMGNSSFATDGLLGQQLNGDLFLNSVSWLSQQDDQVLTIRPKEVTNRRLVLSVPQQMASALISMAILPAIGLLAAGLVWWKRR